MNQNTFEDRSVDQVTDALRFKQIPDSGRRASLKRNEVFVLISGNPRLTPAGAVRFNEAPDSWVQAVLCGELSSSEVVAQLNGATEVGRD